MRKKSLTRRITAAFLAVVLCLGSVLVSDVDQVYAEDTSDITYSETTVSLTNGGGNIGGTASSPVVLTNGTQVYLYSYYSAKYLKMIREMETSSTNTIKYKVPVSEYINVASLPPQQVKVTVNGKEYILGTLEYDRTPGSEGLYITYNKGDKEDLSTLNGLYALLRDCLSTGTIESMADVVGDTGTYQDDYIGTSYNGSLEFSGTIEVAGEKYNQTLALENMGLLFTADLSSSIVNNK